MTTLMPPLHKTSSSSSNNKNVVAGLDDDMTIRRFLAQSICAYRIIGNNIEHSRSTTNT
jgi:hypothetical protein